MEFVIISGRSGSGKSTALQLLEDTGYTCIDNLPINLLPALIAETNNTEQKVHNVKKFAVGIDARNFSGDLNRFPEIINEAKQQDIKFTIAYLDASNSVLIKRFSETRRKHPLSTKTQSLEESINAESILLEPIARLSDITINTSTLSLHELRSAIKKKIAGDNLEGMALMIESFGFKYGNPVDADFIFDVRCLPNPFWLSDLRSFTGQQEPVQEFLSQQEQVNDMQKDIIQFIEKWIPSFEQNNRSYLTVAIGCTGGVHRSVYLAEQISQYFQSRYKNVQTRHKQLMQQTGHQ
jgi:UPF0042 nucleotide-binding protein